MGKRVKSSNKKTISLRQYGGFGGARLSVLTARNPKNDWMQSSDTLNCVNLSKTEAKKFVYLAICTRLAHAILPNGENAHCTVKEPDWWEKHIIKSNKNKIHTEVHWYGNHNDYRKYNISS